MPLTDPSEDLALLNDMRRGNAAAFEALYRRHQAPLYRFALLRVRKPEVAEDLVQDSLLAAVRSVENFSGRSTERSWLVGILKNKISEFQLSSQTRKTCFLTMITTYGIRTNQYSNELVQNSLTMSCFFWED